MRALTKLSLTVALSLGLSAPAGAVVSIGLVQVGGTYSAGLGANPGDTLVLSITYNAGGVGDSGIVVVDPAIAFDGAVQSFDAPASTETGLAAWSGGAVSIGPVATGDIGLVTPHLAGGWEKAAIGLTGYPSYEVFYSPCVFGACTSLGTAAFVLSGNSGRLWIGGVGLTGGTVIGDATFGDIADISDLGTFTIIPEPTTAGLLGLALLVLTALRRRKR